MEVYAQICDHSLAYNAHQAPQGFSRINYDGTPFQFAVASGAPTPALRFLSDPAAWVSSGAERIKLGQDCIRNISRLLNLEAELLKVSTLLDEIAPSSNPALVADHAGAFWIGVNFAPGQEPQLVIYVNSKWGKVHEAWNRLRRFVSYFDGDQQWGQIERAVANDMQPVGVALTLARGNSPEGRVYLSSYGKLMTWYEDLPIWNESLKPFLRQYAELIFDEDRSYPLPTVVCSFGFGGSSDSDAKFEVCGHCIFPSDVEAVRRLRAWLRSADIDEAPYLDVLKIVSENCLSGNAPVLHSYVGLGLKKSNPYSTVYLKPHFVTPVQ
jgi:hypothetical protein